MRYRPTMRAASDAIVTRLLGLAPGRHDDVTGIDMHPRQQVELLRRLRAELGDELERLPLEPYDAAPGQFYVANKSFESVDAELLYAMVRWCRPRLVVAVGTGWSTVLAHHALTRNRNDGAPGRLVAVEPRAIRTPGPGSFEALAADDILFVDSTRGCDGAEARVLALDVLPRLPDGVVVHLAEEHVLPRLLALTRGYEVLAAAAYLQRRFPSVLAETIPSFRPNRWQPTSVWLRRVTRVDGP